MILCNQTELIRYNTRNSAPPTICWPKRPCYREVRCVHCQRRRRRFILRQLAYFGVLWNFSAFYTITATRFTGNEREALGILQQVRTACFQSFLRQVKFVAVVSCHSGPHEFGRSTVPHFHMLLDEAPTPMKIKKALRKAYARIEWNLQVKPVDPTTRNLRRLGGYLMDRNYQVTLPHRLSRQRLITASRGFLTGRPQPIPHVDAWEAGDAA